jgi:hypothetical protein
MFIYILIVFSCFTYLSLKWPYSLRFVSYLNYCHYWQIILMTMIIITNLGQTSRRSNSDPHFSSSNMVTNSTIPHVQSIFKKKGNLIRTVRQRTRVLPFLFSFKYTLDAFLVCQIIKINNHWQGISILIQFKFDLNSIKSLVQYGVQLNILMWLKSMKIQLEFDWVEIEIQLIGMAFN